MVLGEVRESMDSRCRNSHSSASPCLRVSVVNHIANTSLPDHDLNPEPVRVIPETHMRLTKR